MNSMHEDDGYPKTGYVDKDGNHCFVMCCGEEWCDVYYECCSSDVPLCAPDGAVSDEV